ncbi:sugar (pentulose or hexulose) kinase [Gracilibacillus halotolerans]|uniref:Sugar (Pentulose or hexulose) kinase n=1 Tax=Gracilibacillus halotolerans TaxID=74386 RepID=A0A841RLT0_9BACI|nr:FGGY-family carbohydrate kinase [Gracilibacillus halotolerans]MBB6513449.1 sugar (pentulose or hexulose) kinase [Gracilibacillus halotolerans]
MSVQVQRFIEDGNAVLGIELGSTRIKSVLIGENGEPIASGGHEWENSYVDNIWTYSEEDIWKGVQDSYRDMASDVQKQYGVQLKKIAAIGFSGMMHGYMAFNQEGEMLVPFRTWRNNFTGQASKELTELFQYNIPQRWSIAHLYQAILNKEEHVKEVSFITTIAGYIHWKLTGEKILGVGEASGVFPIDLEAKTFHPTMIQQFDQLIEPTNVPWKLEEILPEVRVAGEEAGSLTVEGAKLLDVSGELVAGIPLCPPEGDAGTGMVATNSVAKRTGNVSAGTSVFAMVVLEKELSKVHTEIDLVTTPTGNLVAMAHSNNCTSDLNAWVGLFGEFAENIGVNLDMDTLYGTLYKLALEGDSDAGGLLSFGYLSGEHMTHFEEGRPLFVRSSESNFNLANFMRVHLFSALGALKIGMDILLKEEKVQLDEILGHGGLFKTEGVGQKIMAGALNVPVSVMNTAGEGGAWGIALLASYMINKENNETLDDFLNNKVFANQEVATIHPDQVDVTGYEQFMDRYVKGLAIERAAVENLK